jgi:Type VI secretion system VasI, EvfG, VC_A0118
MRAYTLCAVEYSFSRFWGLAVVLAVIATITTASAQGLFDALGLALCHKLPQNEERLKCYDRTVETMRRQPATEENAEPPTWDIEETKSPIDDTPQITGTLADTKKSGLLFLRCKERQIEAGVQTTADLGNTGSDAATVVLTRINSDQPVKTAWQGATNGKGAFAPKGFIYTLPDNAILFLRIHNFRGEPHDFTFNLANVSTVRDKVLAACKPSAPQPRPRPADKTPMAK